MDKLYVHYGCHTTAPKEWLNFDSSPTMRFERVPLVGRLYSKNDFRFPDNIRFGDITKGLPVDDQACIGAYASHVLEHLSYQGCRKALDETFRILTPGGLFRAVVPDLELAARRYLDRLDNGLARASETFMRETLLGVDHRPSGLLDRLISSWGGGAHLWMWDYHSLSAALKDSGFVDVRRCAFGDSPDSMFDLVESESRFKDAAAVEGRRP